MIYSYTHTHTYIYKCVCGIYLFKTKNQRYRFLIRRYFSLREEKKRRNVIFFFLSLSLNKHNNSIIKHLSRLRQSYQTGQVIFARARLCKCVFQGYTYNHTRKDLSQKN